MTFVKWSKVNRSKMDVCVVGSCNVDFSSFVSHHPKEGETLKGYKFEIGFGGKGANQCVAAAKLGAKVAMIGKLGDDVFGGQYLDNLRTNSVNCDHMSIIKGESTGVASISVAENGSNNIIVVTGANDLITVQDVEAAEELIKSSKVIVCQNEIPQDATLAALQLARKHGLKTVLNPAPVQENYHPDLFAAADIFCPNEKEAELLAGQPVNSIETAKSACRVLTESKGCSSVIITMGRLGVVYQETKEAEPIHIETTTVNAVDTTGAGDSFAGSLSYFLAKRPDLPILEMIKRANQVAAISVLKEGTQKSFPLAKELPPHILA